MKARNLIEDAMLMAGRKALGTALDGDTLAYGLRRLNQLIDEWQAQGLYIPFTTEVIQAITGSPVTIGATGTVIAPMPAFVRDTSFFRIGGLDFPLEWIDIAEFNRIPLKAIDTYPVYASYVPGDTLGNLYFYPRPTNYELHLYIDDVLPAFVDYDTDYSLQKGYHNALTYTLAEVFCEGVRPVSQDIARKAMSARAVVRENNVKPIMWQSPSVAHGVRRWVSLADFLSGGAV
jgi:hypothetical protein